MKSKRTGMPKKALILEYWREKLIQNFGKFWLDDEYDHAVCFACGTPGVVERAHIIPVCDGGVNDASNIHLLCRECHVESEGLFNKSENYFLWLKHKNPENSASRQRQMSLAKFYSSNDCVLRKDSTCELERYIANINPQNP